MKNILLVSILILLTGCSTSSGFDAKSTSSGFDGGRTVTIRPHGTACTSSICTGLGAQWSSTDPGNALLIVSIFNDIQGIIGAELNVDGKLYQLQRNSQLTNFDSVGAYVQNSSQSFIVPLSLIKELTNSKRTWLRVQTTRGYIEDAVIDSGKDSKAYHALKRFLTEVE